MAEITETRTKERIKQTGEVFTPLALVDEILLKLPPELLKDPTKTFLDPAAGDGNFVVQVIRHKIHHGSTVWEALSTTYAVELMPDNVEHMKERVLALADDHDPNIFGMAEAKAWYGPLVDHNYICANSLEFDYDSWQPFGSDCTSTPSEKIMIDDLLEW